MRKAFAQHQSVQCALGGARALVVLRAAASAEAEDQALVPAANVIPLAISALRVVKDGDVVERAVAGARFQTHHEGQALAGAELRPGQIVGIGGSHITDLHEAASGIAIEIACLRDGGAVGVQGLAEAFLCSSTDERLQMRS